MKSRLLIVDDDPSTRLVIRIYMEAYGYEIDEADTCAGAIEKLTAEVADLVLLDYALSDGTALDVLRQLKLKGIDVPVILLTGHGSIELAVEAIKEGADQFLTKPVELAALAVLADRVIDHQQNSRRVQVTHAKQAGNGIENMFSGRSAANRALARDVRAAADCDAPILIEGETGTGKGMLARWIHNASARATESFVDLNCAGLPRDLLESELFGHERGAFTGAHAAKAGLLEAAHRGTMFLDEIGDTDMAIQPKLLKVVEEKRFRRLGDVGERRVDVRFIAATNRNLVALVDEGKFREDLYYRINTLVLRLPPLRHRTHDIMNLANRLLDQLARDIPAARAMRLGPDAGPALLAHSWPGNVRELRNVIERAMLVSSSPIIHAADLRLDPARAGPARSRGSASGGTLDEIEWQHIQRAIEEERGSVSRAALRLGIPRSTLYQKLKFRKSGGQ